MLILPRDAKKTLVEILCNHDPASNAVVYIRRFLSHARCHDIWHSITVDQADWDPLGNVSQIEYINTVSKDAYLLEWGMEWTLIDSNEKIIDINSLK